MKKKNKKNWSMGEILGITLMIGTILFLIGHYTYFSFSKPSFSIYKEECHNGTGFELYCGNDTVGIKMWAYGIELNKTDKILIKYLLNDIDYKDCEYVFSSYCEEIEVDEIEIRVLDYYDTCGMECKDNTNSSRATCSQMECFGENYNIETISKKDLTIEWFEENCECILLKDEKDYLCEPSYEKCVKTMDKPYCSKYSCGENYTLEVVR